MFFDRIKQWWRPRAETVMDRILFWFIMSLIGIPIFMIGYQELTSPHSVCTRTGTETRIDTDAFIFLPEASGAPGLSLGPFKMLPNPNYNQPYQVEVCLESKLEPPVWGGW